MSLDGGPLPTGEWECMECGYIEAGVKTQRPQVCPDCGAPTQALEFFSYEDEDDEAGWDDEQVEDPGDVFEKSTGLAGGVDPEEDDLRA